MKPMTRALHLGLVRGWIEFKLNSLTHPGVFPVLLAPAVLLGILWLFRERQSDGYSSALLLLPSFLGFQLIQEALMGVANKLAFDREDGTLLRAKALPQGMLAYLVARSVMTVLSALLGLLLVLIPGVFIVPDLANLTGAAFLTLGWVTVLGFLAIAPLGAVIGALVKSPAAALGLTLVPLVITVAISGIFFPIARLPGWVQLIAQVFPMYWLGLGLRSVFLPAAAAAQEVGASWRPLETALVLAAWAGAGLLLAPGLLRRMARRTSGSDMEAGRRRYTQRG